MTSNQLKLSKTLHLIADIAEGSATTNSLPHIAKIAREALSQADDSPEFRTLNQPFRGTRWQIEIHGT